jgi:glycosyltransferase involved in cell wall biosynthesis
MKLSIVVPAYNEEGRIGKMLEAYLPYFAGRYGDDVEIIVSINHSSDRTEEIVRSFQPRFAQLQVTVDPAPIGKGGAIMAGGRLARGIGSGLWMPTEPRRPKPSTIWWPISAMRG